MANRTIASYPPYEGAEPYVFLCFSQRDERRVRPLLRRLLRRGCRIWYSLGEVRDRAALAARNGRMLGAGLAVLYLTAAAREDTDLKARLLFCQRAGMPILVLNTDGGDSGLSLGLTGEASVNLARKSADDATDAILHGQGFSQAFLGEPQPVYDRLRLRRISAALLVLSLLLGAGVGAYAFLHPPQLPPPPEVEVEPEPEEPAPTKEPADEVLIRDEALQAVARSAVGGGRITVAALARIEALSLSQLPASTEDLSVFPNLTTLILSQEAAQAAPQQPELYERYTLILAGGEGQ